MQQRRRRRRRKKGRKEGRKEGSKLASSCFCRVSHLSHRVSRLQLHVLYSRVSMAFSLWYLLFGCPCPCLRTPSGSVSARELPLPLSLCLSVCVEKCLHHPLDDGGISIFTGRYSGARTYIQMERLAFPRVHSRRVQPAGATRGRTRGSLATKTQTESWQRERERERRRVIVKPWHSGFIFW